MKRVITTAISASFSDPTYTGVFWIQPLGEETSFWQTWWFIGLLVVGLGAFVVGGFRWRLNLIREQNVYQVWAIGSVPDHGSNRNRFSGHRCVLPDHAL